MTSLFGKATEKTFSDFPHSRPPPPQITSVQADFFPRELWECVRTRIGQRRANKPATQRSAASRHVWHLTEGRGIIVSVLCPFAPSSRS